MTANRLWRADILIFVQIQIGCHERLSIHFVQVYPPFPVEVVGVHPSAGFRLLVCCTRAALRLVFLTMGHVPSESCHHIPCGIVKGPMILLRVFEHVHIELRRNTEDCTEPTGSFVFRTKKALMNLDMLYVMCIGGRLE